VVVSTYQAVSGTGAAAVAELEAQSHAAATGATIPAAAVYPRQIAFNALPQVDSFGEDGYTKEELKMRNETRKILHLPELPFAATCVRIPVYVGHSEAVTVECERPIDIAGFSAALAATPGVRVAADPAAYPTPLDAAGDDDVLVGRIRPDQSQPGAVTFWVTADNLRKGAALNAIQIARTLLERDALRVP
jgi:aspartate-semialdehyde dehydrogenase